MSTNIITPTVLTLQYSAVHRRTQSSRINGDFFIEIFNIFRLKLHTAVKQIRVQIFRLINLYEDNIEYNTINMYRRYITV